MKLHKNLRAAAIAGLLSALPLLCMGQDSTPPLSENILLPPRWSVMTGSDPDAVRVSPKPVPTTPEKLAALPRPATLPRQGPPPPQYRSARVGTAERTLWSVEAHIVESRLNADGTYNLMLRGASGQRIFCDLPDPGQIPHPGPFTRQMIQARAALAARLHSTAIPRPCDVRARITSLGYYGRVRPGDPGPANGLQLRPVVGISFPK